MAAAFMAAHHGVASRGELLGLGLTTDQVEHGVRSKVLLPRHPGVYRHAAHPAAFHGEVRAAVLAAPHGFSYVSGPALMRLRGLDGWWDPTPEVTIVGTQPARLRGVRVRRLDSFYADDIETRSGLPCLRLPLGLLLLGAVVPPARVRRAIHSARRLGLVSREDLELSAVRYGGRGRRGMAAYRAGLASLPAAGGGCETGFEVKVLGLLRRGGLREPVLQHALVDGDGRRRYLDFAYLPELVAVEADGDYSHSTPEDRAADALRTAALAAVGWHVERVTEEDYAARPEAVIARIRRSLSARR